MTSRLGLAAATLALLTTTLTGLGSPATAGATAHQATTTADPLYGAPAVGQCFDMSRAELDRLTYTEAPVDCSGLNTSEVLAVAMLPDGVGYGDEGKLSRIVQRMCRPVVEERLGTNTLGFRLTAYLMAYFAPTQAQQAAGARWLRCDLVRQGGKRLLPLPGTLGVGAFPFSKRVSKCLTGRQHLVTVCGQPHNYRATSAFTLRGKRYPSQNAWVRAGNSICPRGVTTPRNFRFTWSSRAAWATGDKSLVCYSHTRR